jgi:hypothetical protein
MTDWWPAIGQTSTVAGATAGLLWAFASTRIRRRRFARAATMPVGQTRWFLASFLGMGGFTTLATALGLASLNGYLPAALFWYLLGLAVVAFAAALMFPSAMPHRPLDAPLRSGEPSADPPSLTVRKSA